MQAVTTIGLDIAAPDFHARGSYQLHAIAGAARAGGTNFCRSSEPRHVGP